MTEILSIKEESGIITSTYDLDDVENLTQILAELEILRIKILREYLKK